MSSPPFKVKAVYEYNSQHDDDLHFSNGQIITVIEEEDDEWYSGKYLDDSGSLQQGIFPKNFVERYEPTAPPRPTRAIRPKKETELTQEVTTVISPSAAAPKHVNIPTNEQLQSTSNNEHPHEYSHSELNTPIEILQTIQPTKVSRPTPESKSPALEASHSHGSEKPTGNSFKDRIAAFNKPASPVAPFKPGKLSSSFVKKPFVAPPPSKNAYVPIPRDHPTPKFYRRDEDNDISIKGSESYQRTEVAVLTPSFKTVDEDEPKPTSLKERIALLQKQQMEQASRLADVSHKKEKSKRPVTKHTDSNTQAEAAEEGDSVSLERVGTDETTGKSSLDSLRDEQNQDHKHSEKKAEIDEKLKVTVITQAPIPQTRNTDSGEGDSITETELVEHNSEDDEEIDPEVRRKEELRARMAKMSGGMGMHGIFGPPGGMPMPIVITPSKKKENSGDKNSDENKIDDSRTATIPAGSNPVIPIPSRTQEPVRDLATFEELRTVESDNTPYESLPPQVATHDRDAPPIPGGRPALPIQKDIIVLDAIPTSPGTGSESDDEFSSGAQDPTSVNSTAHQHHQLHEEEGSSSPTLVHSKQDSRLGANPSSPTSPVNPIANKRASRPPPPIPSGFVSPKLQARTPPPPPPGINNLSSTNEQRSQLAYLSPATASEESEEVTEYEGDYDTDITPTLPHKDPLKIHARDKSTEDHIPTSSPILLPSSEPPPIPSSVAHRVHAPVPLQLISDMRPSVVMPRSAPPPPPNGTWEHDDEHDPYRYVAPKQRAPSVPSAVALVPDLDTNEEDLYSASPPRSPYASQERKPQLPPRDYVASSGNRAPPRTSLDVSRSASVRRSIDLSRISLDSGYLANDIDLAPKSFWWIQPNGTPPVFQGRKDILFECEETSITKNGKVMMTKELYVLFLDYSQTIVSVYFDPQNPADVKLEQRHEQPPSRLRQDQLEQAHERLGRLIFDGVIARKETVVGDGTPQGLVTELLRPLSDALLPIGTRSYGALVYGNIANASTQQNDEIRPGDLITFRNARFQGKHGPLNAKYSMEVGKPDHVGIVAEWDGTKKKIRAWEQGRESRKVKLESFKLDDLRSGEVKIWRIMPRSWVGWEGQN
ncbi:hypothetical protein K3495_g3682 [Podosphaera aphanis]|nr:hypothetical protein K3495_g3682 [Podosphaera aphanis]